MDLALIDVALAFIDSVISGQIYWLGSFPLCCRELIKKRRRDLNCHSNHPF